MRPICTVCLLVTWSSLASYAQDADWIALMADGHKAEVKRDYAAALTYFRRAADTLERSSPRDPRLAQVLDELSDAELASGDATSAEADLRRALNLVKTFEGQNSLDSALLSAHLALLYSSVGRFDEAEGLLRRALAIHVAGLGENDSATASIRVSLAQVLLKRKQSRQAEDLLQNAIRTLEANHDRDDRLAAALNDMGVIRQYRRADAEAADLFERALGVLEAALGRNHPMLLPSLVNLATVQAASGHFTDATATWSRADHIAEDRSISGYPHVRETLTSYAAFLKKTGQKQEAARVGNLAKTLGQDHCCDDRGWTIDAFASRK
ncbi:MAG TPA: tetratricopeptide repeat protein [Bryobacteraceae bacterium]|nr:tetratricopeptide repeat protein [Bryobacteraceae bacterium]